MQKRYLFTAIEKDALEKKKMAFISGPRQVGKTTLGKSFLKSEHNYFTWENPQFRRIFTRDPLKVLEERASGPILFDEIHKDKKWKNNLKAIYDIKGKDVEILVTGSARLDFYRKGGDSLIGRYLPYRLHPFTVAENDKPIEPDLLLQKTVAHYKWDDLLKLGGFPEPLFNGSEAQAKRWSRLRTERLTYEDIRDIKAIHNLNSLKSLVEYIPQRVGNPFSMNALSEDVGVSFSTVREWIQTLEALYYGFFVRPYSKNIKRAVKAEPKFYLFDILQLPKEKRGPIAENLCALHLLKACHYWTDLAFGNFELNYVRDKEKREVDFLIVRDKKPWMLVECKSNSKNLSAHLVHYSKLLQTPLNFQLTTDSKFDREYPEHQIRVLGYEKFFSGLI
jgi:predicted AAA+ superfamily ATPase